MTQTIMVANRSGTVQTPDGQLFRLRAGLTYADPGHVAVTSYPDDWRALTVELAGPAGRPADVAADEELREELAVAEENVERLSHALASVVGVLENAGMLGGVDTGRDGWLADRIAELLVQGPATRPAPAAPSLLFSPPDAEERTTIRAWAAANDIPHAARGALAQTLVEQYRAAGRG